MNAIRLRLEHLYADLDRSMSGLRQRSEPVTHSRRIVEQALLDGRARYGINTGFGVLANKLISSEDLATLQKNILQETDRETLNGVARELLDPDNMAIVVVGDEAAIRPELEALGMPITELNEDGIRIE